MKQISKILVMTLFFSITGCTIQPPEPNVFGIPQTQWNQLTPAQQQSIIDGYNQRQRIEAENAPLESAINATQQILKKEHKKPNNFHSSWDSSSQN